MLRFILLCVLITEAKTEITSMTSQMFNVVQNMLSSWQNMMQTDNQSHDTPRQVMLSPIVTTKQGTVQGVVADDGDYYAFYGIRYGGDTSGENRFKAPTPPPIRNHVFTAVEKHILCPQPSAFLPIGVEDCLRLSIFTNSTGKQLNKTVIVWIDGEDFTTSNPLQHSFRRLVEENVVVVAVNYRVSIFGFLCLRIVDAQGNAGLKDVIQALKWIRHNIAEFGGDPNNVVLFGHGSGAAIVDFITLSKLSQGLVHKAIALSGSSLASWAITRDPIGQAFKFASKLAFSLNNTETLVSLLRNIDIDILLLAQHNFERDLSNTVAFAPCIENRELSPNNTFLDNGAVNLLLRGDFNRNVPFIFGYTNKEGTMRLERAVTLDWINAMETKFSNFLPADLRLMEGHHQAIRRYYFGNQPIDFKCIDEFINYYGDMWIVHPLIRSVMERVKNSFASVWLLEFQYRGMIVLDWEYPEITLTGVPHGQILNYILDFDTTKNDNEISNDIVQRFVKFAKTGIPNFKDRVKWYPMTSHSLNYIVYFGGYGYSTTGNKWFWGLYPAAGPRLGMRSLWEPLYQTRYDEAPTYLETSTATLFYIPKLIFIYPIVLMCLH